MSNQNSSKTASAPKRFALNDQTNLRFLREAINKNLEEFAREYGIQIEAANISYKSDGCSCKVTVKVTAPNETGEIQSEYERDWNKFRDGGMLDFICQGLKPEHLGYTFTHRGNKFSIIGLAPKRRKFPIVAKNVVTGKVTLFTHHILPVKPKVGGLTLAPMPPRTEGRAQ